jgi:rod shape-determining protein MreC
VARISFGRRRIIVLLILTSILLITLDARGNPVLGGARRAAATVMSPLQGVGRAIVRPIDNAWNGIRHYDELRKENEQLRIENEQERGNSAAYLSILNDYQGLLQSSDLPWLNQYQRIAAQVLGPVSNDFQQAIEINQGRNHGIREGMPVVCGAGLVGKITRALDATSYVLLLTDTSYTVSAKVSSVPGRASTTTTIPDSVPAESSSVPESTDTTTPETASSIPATRPKGPTKPLVPVTSAPPTTTPTSTVPSATTTTLPFTSPPTTIDLGQLSQIELGGLQGNGPGKLPTLDFISADQQASAIRVGDIVSTSGGATANGLSLAPPGLPIGLVSKKVERPGVSGPHIEVTPSCDLAHLSLLRVILYSPTASG